MRSSGTRSVEKDGIRRILDSNRSIREQQHLLPDAAAVYIVFEVAPLEDPAQFGAQWFAIGEDGKPADVAAGQDTLEVPGHERYGFLELKKPGDQWPVGMYLVKLYITSLGQQPFHAVNQVGTMRFSIVDSKSSADPAVTKDQPPR